MLWSHLPKKSLMKNFIFLCRSVFVLCPGDELTIRDQFTQAAFTCSKLAIETLEH